jgi:hypothetical protein
LALNANDDSGEAAYNLESATIERYDGGFLVVAKNTGMKQWHPDAMVRCATWELTRDTEPAPPPDAE